MTDKSPITELRYVVQLSLDLKYVAQLSLDLAQIHLNSGPSLLIHRDKESWPVFGFYMCSSLVVSVVSRETWQKKGLFFLHNLLSCLIQRRIFKNKMAVVL